LALIITYINTDKNSSAPVGFLFLFLFLDFHIIELTILQQLIIEISLSLGALKELIF